VENFVFILHQIDRSRLSEAPRDRLEVPLVLLVLVVLLLEVLVLLLLVLLVLLVLVVLMIVMLVLLLLLLAKVLPCWIPAQCPCLTPVIALRG
jgi:hypothetical protein